MATLDDMTGWRDELERLRPDTPLYKKLYSKEYREGPRKRIPLERLILFAEVMLKNKETREAITQLFNYYKLPDQPEFGELADDPRYPHWAPGVLMDFTVWFTLKTEMPPNDAGYMKFGGALAASVALGTFATVRRAEAVNAIKNMNYFATFIEA